MLAPNASFCKRFQVCSIPVLVQSTQSLDWLEDDFAYFTAVKPIATQTIVLNIKPLAMAQPPELSASHVYSQCVVFNSGSQSWIDYHGSAWLHRHNATQATLYADDKDLTQELSYLFLQSVLGQLLEQRGLFRVHCLSFTFNGQGVLFLTPSGGGKSSLTLGLLDQSEVQLLGDDICLVDTKGNLWPYPMRFSFSPSTILPAHLESKTVLWSRRQFGQKKLLPIAALPRPPSPGLQAIAPAFLIIAERWTKRSQAKAEKISKFNVIPTLLRELVVGIGLPQVAELVLTQGFLKNLQLCQIAFKRLLVACVLLSRSDCIKLKMSHNHKDNAQELLSALRNLTIKR
jgi:hypothetical protein